MSLITVLVRAIISKSSKKKVMMNMMLIPYFQRNNNRFTIITLSLIDIVWLTKATPSKQIFCKNKVASTIIAIPVQQN